VHPDYRGQGLSRLLYDTRRNLIRRLNLKGHVAGGLPVGYGAVKSRMTIEDYVGKVTAGEIFDRTISIQLRRGFSIGGILYDYLDDASCDGKGVLLVWLNPDYQKS
jgi:GNAT superfamily N-acetyltransferase